MIDYNQQKCGNPIFRCIQAKRILVQQKVGMYGNRCTVLLLIPTVYVKRLHVPKHLNSQM